MDVDVNDPRPRLGLRPRMGASLSRAPARATRQSNSEWANIVSAKNDTISAKNDTIEQAISAKEQAIDAKDQAIDAKKQAIKRADKADQHLADRIQAHFEELAKHKLQYSFRSSLEGLCRNTAAVGNHSTAGSLFKQHLMTEVLEEREWTCNKLSQEALQLYQTIQKADPAFKLMEPSGKMGSWVDSLKRVYSDANEDCHSMSELMSETGVACGGGTINKIFRHAFLIASLQKHCKIKNLPISPVFVKVAVLSPSYKKIVAHVIGGMYVPVESLPEPVPAEEEAEAAEEAAAEAAAEEEELLLACI